LPVHGFTSAPAFRFSGKFSAVSNANNQADPPSLPDGSAGLSDDSARGPLSVPQGALHQTHCPASLPDGSAGLSDVDSSSSHGARGLLSGPQGVLQQNSTIDDGLASSTSPLIPTLRRLSINKFASAPVRGKKTSQSKDCGSAATAEVKDARAAIADFMSDNWQPVRPKPLSSTAE